MTADVTTAELVLFGCVNFGVAILSGAGGAGGGFVSTPLLIFLGLSPAQAVATGKLGGLAISLGSIGGMRRVPQRSKRQLALILVLAVSIGLLAPLAISQLDSAFYRRMLGVLLLLMIPLLIIKKVGRAEHEPTAAKKVLGWFFLVVSLCLQAVFSGGLGTLVNIVLMAFLGMSALEANVTKRYSQVVLNSVITVGLLTSGLIMWPMAFVLMGTSLIGGFVGGKLATKRGDGFVMSVFILLMFVSALELIFG